MSQPLIYARNLSKWYGQVIGLNYLNIDVMPGITGIVGPNGAGKSTFFKLATGMIKPNVGELYVMGERPWGNTRLLSQIGFCPDYENLPEDLTGGEFIRFVGHLHHLKGTELQGRVDEVMNTVGLGRETLERKIGGYSKGMRQRLKIASSLLHDPKILILDEPLSGTDPIVRNELISLIKALNKDLGHSVVISSHVLFEIERVTRNVALIYKGRAVAVGNISDIRGLIDKYPHNIIIECDRVKELAKTLLGFDYVVSVAFNQERTGIIVQVTKPDAFFDTIPEIISGLRCRVGRMYSLDDNLESVFRYLVGW